MTDRPIIFSAPMVRALRYRRKTQTRRVLRLHDDDCEPPYVAYYLEGAGAVWCDPYDSSVWCYPGVRGSAVGDRLWVREAHYMTDDGESEYAVYAADELEAARHINEVGQIAAQHGLPIEWTKRHTKLRSPIHMPKWASRLTLIVTDVRVQRVQEISKADAKAEGVVDYRIDPDFRQEPEDDFADFWDSLNARRGFGFDANPWVVALTFTVHHQNIDQMPREDAA